MIFDAWIDGIPRAQPRSRAKTVGKMGRIHVYVPRKDPVTTWKRDVMWGWRQHHDKPVSGPVRLMMTFYFPRPKRLQGAPEGTIPHTGVPDVDNLCKAVMDALKNVAWDDDRQVYDISMQKLYVDHGHPPGVYITLWGGDD